jgi:uncharacterized membrane protein
MFLALFALLGKMWHRLGTIERRLEAVELGPAAAQAGRARAAAERSSAAAQAGRARAAADERSWDLGAKTAPQPFAHEPEPEFEPEADAVPSPEPAVAPEPAPEPVAGPEPALEPAFAAASVPEPEPAEPDSDPARGFGLEELFGRRLPIWAGGITLAVAGVLIVRYSIEAGLLSPLVRFIAGLAFGTGLIAAAELALRLEEKIRDPRVRQSLAGAGIASLYASILVGVNLYALIGPMTAFAAMAAVTVVAMGLSLRFGAPSALLGLVGGLAAPALVGAGEPNVPLLALYLAFAVAGLCVLSRAQRWMWLGAGALAGGLGWGVVLVLGGMLDTAASLSIGFYLLVVGIALPLVALPNASRLLRVGGSLAAAAQMAALVATGGFSLLHWGLFGLISIAIVWLSRREEAFERLPAVGLALVLLLGGAWPSPAAAHLALVLVAAALVYGGPALLALWRPKGGLVEVGQIAALSLGGAFLAAIHFYRTDESANLALAGVALAAACFPAAAALLGWRNRGRGSDARFSLLVCASALLAGASACFAIPIETLPLAIAAIAGALLLLSLASEDVRIEPAAWVAAVTGVGLISGAPGFEAEAQRLFGFGPTVEIAMALLRWGGLACAALVFAGHARLKAARAVAQAAAAILAYGAAAQAVPAQYLSLVGPTALLALAFASRARATRRLLPALAVALAVSLCWTVLPLLLWTKAGLASLVGQPMFASELPALRDTVQRLLAPALLIAVSARTIGRHVEVEMRRVAVAGALVLATVAAHILFKQAVGLRTAADFVSCGVAERSLWEVVLLAAAAAAWRLGSRPAAFALGGAAVAHLAWYSLILHNPLWAEQAVGPLPVVNLLFAIYGLPLALLAAAGRIEPGLPPRLERMRSVLQMLLVIFFAFSTLRQLVHGSVLIVPGLSQGEDIARSMLAVALAIGFLVWGMRRRSRDWRIGSLVLMLGAVAKVFLLDASGLEGLMRIASFVALGFSLIGIGWLYSRSLGGERPR